MTAEKSGLLPSHAAEPPKARSRRVWVVKGLILVFGFGLLTHLSAVSSFMPGRCKKSHSKINFEELCPQVEPISPQYTTKELDAVAKHIKSSEYFKHSVDLLQNATRIPTVSYDDLRPPGQDDRWKIFNKFEKFLNVSFPLVHKHLDFERVNQHGLIYTWTGSDKNLKPTILMSHQDVVPVAPDTKDQWKYDPFSGHFDGTYIWGRGSSDDKNQLIANLEAVELLLKAGFKPKRTVILSLGCDEEISGYYGAQYIADALYEKYGDDGIAVIVDEGSTSYETWGQVFMLPGVAEKGYINVDITVRTPGGHSSVPPPHTSIGILAELITKIEANPYPVYLADENPFYTILLCGAAHAPDFPSDMKKLIEAGDKQAVAEVAAASSPIIRYLMSTSVAVDLIHGGVKVNALPESATVTVNHRVNIGSNTNSVKVKIEKLAEEIAKKYQLSLIAYPKNATFPASSITLEAGDPLEPAPVTPTNIDAVTPFQLIAGTTREIYGEDKVVSPGAMNGNTDTKWFWKLSKHIFRYGPQYSKNIPEGLGGIHTVNEHSDAAAHVSMVEWFYTFLRNVDEADFSD